MVRGKNFPLSVEGEKVVLASKMKEMEEGVISRGEKTSDELMISAAAGMYPMVLRFMQERQLKKKVILLCGKGNNGGDAYAIGEELLENEMVVVAYQIFPLEKSSDLLQKHAKQFQDKGGKIVEVQLVEEIFFEEGVLVIDGLLGTGFKGRIDGVLKEAILKLNGSKNFVISIDIPSGVQGDTGIVEELAVIGDVTLYLGVLKVGHLYNQGVDCVGDLYPIDFGLDPKNIDAMESFGVIVNPNIVKQNLPLRKASANKYSVGQVMIIGGSQAMSGAPILAAKAALRCGAGIVRLAHPENIKQLVVNAPLEVVKMSYTLENMSEIVEELKRTKAVLIGPGLGRKKEVPIVLEKIYNEVQCPIVVDGDALFFFNGGVKNAILTPHKGELKHLLKVEGEISDIELIEKAESFAALHNVVMVFKGPNTTVIAPSFPKVIIPFGNSSMASGGMGDALSGVILSFIAQGKDLREAAILGATIHAMAGDKVREVKSKVGMIASDLIEAIPSLFSNL